MTEQPLAPGLHKHLVTKGVQLALAADVELGAEFAKVDPADQPHVLARHIYELTRRALEGRAEPDGRLQLLNDLVALLEVPAAEVDAPARQLRRLAMTPGPGVLDIEAVRPKTPLSDAALLTNSVGEPNLAAELRAEIDTSDEVDLSSYQREEILAAIDYAHFQRKPTSMIQGVAYSEPLKVDAFFVTLKKSEADYSPTTMYRDYPISPNLFHWESQNATSVASPAGQRYLSGSSTVLIFCRIEHKGEYDTAPYLLLGPASYVSHVGERPIAITWKLQHSIPSTFFDSASLAAS